MNDIDKTVEDASKVLAPLIKDCAKLICDDDLSPRTQSELRSGVAGWKVELESGNLSMDDLCGLIESIYGIIFVAKKQCARFDARYPGVTQRLENAQKFVLEATGKFVGPDGKTIIELDI